MKVTKRKAKGVLADMIANMDEDSLAKTREKMERITEDYCSQEVRNLLVTKGFVGDIWYNNDDLYISHALAMKWLREKGYHIVVFTDSPRYEVMIQDLNDGSFNVSGITHTYDTYEEAVEAALKYCLENLI